MNLPDSWEIRKVGDFVEQPLSGVSVPAHDQPPRQGQPGVLRLSCVSNGRFNPSDLKTPSAGQEARLKVYPKKNTILISRSNTPALVGASAYVSRDYPEAFLPDTLWMLQAKDESEITMRWLSYLLATTGFRRLLQRIASGTSQSMKKIQKGAFLNLRTQTPPTAEQEKIAAVLQAWDAALIHLDRVLSAKEHRKRSLMQQLLSGEKRLPGFMEEWQEVRLGDVVRAASRPTPKPGEKFLSAGLRSHGKGVFLKEGFDPGGIALVELFEFREGDLVASITFAWEGAVAIVPREAHGALVSHRFPTYEFDEALASRDYFRHLITTKRFVFDCGLASPGGAGRNRVLNKRDFLRIALTLPPIEEQRRIAEVLNACDREIALHRRQLEAIREQKRGLMQKLLTGEVRVKPDSAE